MSLQAAELGLADVEVTLLVAAAGLWLDLERRSYQLSVHEDTDLRLGRRVVANTTPPHEGDWSAHGDVDAIRGPTGFGRIEVDVVRREADGLNVLGRVSGIDAVVNVHLGGNR